MASVVAALTAVGSVVAEARRLIGQATEVGDTVDTSARRVLVTLRAGSVAERDVVVRRTELAAAQATAVEAAGEVARRRRLHADPHLGAVLHRMSGLTEYRDQLGMVTRTRERFAVIDKEIGRRRAESLTDGTDPRLERVVILVDDLDRCPPEKVVAVLEATHLLFGFEMFAVVLAVDTRWLDQSLGVHYATLLDGAGAGPPDYLEKIIQIPLHLRPLDATMVRDMITGLAGSGVPIDDAGTAAAAPAAGPATDPATPRTRTASRPRPARPPAADTLTLTPAETSAMGDAAPLVGTTPRTVKRYVNVYRLLKTRSSDPSRFDEIREGVGTTRSSRSCWRCRPASRTSPPTSSRRSPERRREPLWPS